MVVVLVVLQMQVLLIKMMIIYQEIQYFLNSKEEQALMIDTKRELKDYLSDQLKNFYSELTSYDPALSGFTHYNYITMVAMRNEVIIIIIIILDYLEIFFVYIASIK